jgi:hypothetical protein
MDPGRLNDLVISDMVMPEKPFTAQGMLAQVKHLLTAEVSDA